MSELADSIHPAFNVLDNHVDDLERSAHQAERTSSQMRATLAELRDGLSMARSRAAAAEVKAAANWNELMRLADAIADLPECPATLVAAVEESFKRLGHILFGKRGDVIPEASNVELVARQPGAGRGRDMVIQCYRVGIKALDGAIVRTAKVVLSE